MFRLKRADFGLVLYPLQKLFRRSRTRSQELVSPRRDLVDFSPTAALGFPDRLQVALLLHRMEQWVKSAGAEVDLESVPYLQVDLVSPARLRFEQAEDDEVEVVLDEPFTPRLV